MAKKVDDNVKVQDIGFCREVFKLDKEAATGWTEKQLTKCAAIRKHYDTDAKIAGFIENGYRPFIRKEHGDIAKNDKALAVAVSEGIKVARCAEVFPRIVELVRAKSMPREKNVLLTICTEVQKTLKEKHKISDAALRRIVNEKCKKKESSGKSSNKPKTAGDIALQAAALLDGLAEYDFGKADNEEIARIADALHTLADRVKGVELA